MATEADEIWVANRGAGLGVTEEKAPSWGRGRTQRDYHNPSPIYGTRRLGATDPLDLIRHASLHAVFRVISAMLQHLGRLMTEA